MRFRIQSLVCAAGAACCFFLVAPGTELRAQNNPSDEKFGPQPTCARKAEDFHKRNLKQYANAPDMLVLPGLVASRRANRVEVLVESTGPSANEAVEFLMIDQTSSHGYEAMLWSYAKPSDVHKALVFLGAKPGLPCSPDNLRFWPEGERIIVSVVTTKGEFKDKPFRIEQMILDTQTGATLPEDGFVFVGSLTLPPPKGQTEPVYAADEYDPKSIASIYNESAAVLDVPRQAPQGELYGRQVVNPERMLPRGELSTVLLVPETRTIDKKVRNLVLGVLPAVPQTNAVMVPMNRTESVPPVQFTLDEADGSTTNGRMTLAAAFVKLSMLVNDKYNPYVAVRFHHSLALSDIHEVALVVALFEEKLGVRIKAPEEGHLYYKAFVPDAAWRMPGRRPSQPWELRLSKADGKIAGKLALNELYWARDSLEPAFSNRSFAVSAPAAVREIIDAEAERRKKAEQTINSKEGDGVCHT